MLWILFALNIDESSRHTNQQQITLQPFPIALTSTSTWSLSPLVIPQKLGTVQFPICRMAMMMITPGSLCQAQLSIWWGPTIANGVLQSLRSPKFHPVTWIVCYLNGNRPDNTAQSEWTRQEVSHRCIHGKCITPSHLCWESKAQNQSRGNKFCSRRCIHEDCQAINVCDCQKFHIPCCI